MFGTAIDLGSSLVGLLKLWKPDDKTLNDSSDALAKARRVNNLLGTSSTTAAAQKTMIRPMVGIEQSLLHADYANDLMTVIQLRDMLAVLSHFELQGVVGNVTIGAMVDSVNPRRGGLASYSGLESFGGVNFLPGAVAGLEARIVPDTSDPNRVMINDKSYANLTEYLPLAVGRTVRASVQGPNGRVDFPLTFRQVPMPMQSDDLMNTFEALKIEDGFLARIDSNTAELITTPELLTGSDVIKQKFKMRMRDLSGMYTESIKRERQNIRQALATGVMSVNTMANTFIISDTTALRIERQVGKKFDNAMQREEIWKKINANTIVIVNEGRGTFRFYTMGDNLVETYTRNEIKTKAGKESSVGSLQDLMKLLNGGI